MSTRKCVFDTSFKCVRPFLVNSVLLVFSLGLSAFVRACGLGLVAAVSPLLLFPWCFGPSGGDHGKLRERASRYDLP